MIKRILPDIKKDIGRYRLYPQSDRIQYLKDEFRAIGGYGDGEEQLFIFRDYLQELFKQFPSLTSFEWGQNQDFNDNLCMYNLDDFIVNDIYSINIPDFLYWETEKEWDYRFSSEVEWKLFFEEHGYHKDSDVILNEREESLQLELAELKLPTDTLLVLLKALYDFYSPYYFIYVFGYDCRVKFSRAGIEIIGSE